MPSPVDELELKRAKRRFELAQKYLHCFQEGVGKGSNLGKEVNELIGLMKDTYPDAMGVLANGISNISTTVKDLQPNDD